MPTISLFKINGETSKLKLIDSLNVDGKDFWITAKKYKYCSNEIFVSFFYYENIEEKIKKIFNEESIEVINEKGAEIIEFLKEKNLLKVPKVVYCFFNVENKVLDIYSGNRKIIKNILEIFEKLTSLKFIPFDYQRVSKIPDIDFITQRKYKVSIFKNKLKFSKSSISGGWRARYELRQVINQIAKGVF